MHLPQSHVAAAAAPGGGAGEEAPPGESAAGPVLDGARVVLSPGLLRNIAWVETARRQLDEVCAAARRANELMATVPLPAYAPSRARVFIIGATNAGKSSLANGLMQGDANGIFCATDIRAETAHCTAFSFDADAYALDGRAYSAVQRTQFWPDLRQAQQRGRGGRGGRGSPSADGVRCIRAALPVAPPKFQPGELADVIDTPGTTEDEALRDGVLRQLHGGGNSGFSGPAVVVFATSLAGGISTTAGRELNTNDKALIEASGVPLHRIVIAATHYDRLVEEQLSDEERQYKPDPMDPFDQRPDPLPPSRKRAAAHEQFQRWRWLVESRYPGVVVVPCARVGPKWRDACDLPLPDRERMYRVLREAVAAGIDRAHRDQVLAHATALQRMVEERLSDAVDGSKRRQGELREAIDEGLSAYDARWASADGEVRGVLSAVQQRVVRERGGATGYLRERSFARDMIDESYDDVTACVRRAQQQSCRDAFRTLSASRAFRAAARAAPGSPRGGEDPDVQLERVSADQYSSVSAEQYAEHFESAARLAAGVGLGGGTAAGGVAAFSVAAGELSVGAWAAGTVAVTGVIGVAFLTAGSLVALAVSSTGWKYDDVRRRLEEAILRPVAAQGAAHRMEVERGLAVAVREVVNIEHMDAENVTAVTVQPAITAHAARLAELRSHLAAREDCCVCMERAPGAVLIPCGHHALCMECVSAVLAARPPLCPLCRRVVTGASPSGDPGARAP